MRLRKLRTSRESTHRRSEIYERQRSAGKPRGPVYGNGTGPTARPPLNPFQGDERGTINERCSTPPGALAGATAWPSGILSMRSPVLQYQALVADGPG